MCHKQTHALQQKRLYSIASSARASSVGGISRPSALEVLICATICRLAPHVTELLASLWRAEHRHMMPAP
jgi:hypothetical protein